GGVAREAIRLTKHVDASPMQVHQAPRVCSDPQTAIAIAKDAACIELAGATWERKGLHPSVDELLDSTLETNEKRAVLVLTNGLYAIRLVRQRVELRRTGFPSP